MHDGRYYNFVVFFSSSCSDSEVVHSLPISKEKHSLRVNRVVYNYAYRIALISDSFSLEDETGNEIYLGVGFWGKMSILSQLWALTERRKELLVLFLVPRDRPGVGTEPFAAIPI